MNPTHAKSALPALADAALALVVGCLAIAMFLPPLGAATAASWPRTMAAGLTIALALPLHWIFLGIAARRLGGSVGGWVGLSVLLFPVGGVAALILLTGLHHPPRTPAPAAR